MHGLCIFVLWHKNFILCHNFWTIRINASYSACTLYLLSTAWQQGQVDFLTLTFDVFIWKTLIFTILHLHNKGEGNHNVVYLFPIPFLIMTFFKKNMFKLTRSMTEWRWPLWGGGQGKREGEMRGGRGRRGGGRREKRGREEGEEGEGGGRGEAKREGGEKRKILRARSARRSRSEEGDKGAGGGR